MPPRLPLEKLPAIKGIYRTAQEKLERGIWPWTTGIRSRLPLHYKMQVVENHMKEPLPVHYTKDERKYKTDVWGEKVRVQNVPIPVKYPKIADEGLWGGVGIIEGLKKKHNKVKKPSHPKIWRPLLFSRIFYSEILDKSFEITVTSRTLNMIDEAFGFDNYILQTHEVDLKSKLGNTLKREMLCKLANGDLYPNNPSKKEEILEKYKDTIVSTKEAEWVGLSITEAEEKQSLLEEKERIENIRPLKEVYYEQLLQELKNSEGEEKEETQSSWFSKLSPFAKKDS